MSVTQLRDGLVRVTISKGHFVQGIQYPRKFGQGHIGRGLSTLHLLHSDISIAVPVRMLGGPVHEGMVASGMKGTYSLRQIKGLVLWRWGLFFIVLRIFYNSAYIRFRVSVPKKSTELHNQLAKLPFYTGLLLLSKYFIIITRTVPEFIDTQFSRNKTLVFSH
jgi:hypothetical protein